MDNQIVIVLFVIVLSLGQFFFGPSVKLPLPWQCHHKSDLGVFGYSVIEPLTVKLNRTVFFTVISHGKKSTFLVSRYFNPKSRLSLFSQSIPGEPLAPGEKTMYSV